MRTVFSFLTIVVMISFLFSCQSKEEKRKLEITNQAYKIFFDAEHDIRLNDTGRDINLDSLSYIYNKLEKENVDSALAFANNVKLISDSIKLRKEEMIRKANLEVQKEWEKSKAGKIQKKYPYWSKEDCDKLANREIWIGMNIRMVYYLYGSPDEVNTSNYGKGNEYQYCWHDWNPGYFYTNEDAIVKSYN